MSGIADSLARVVGRPVVDRTGMEGNFYFMLNYAQLSAQPPEVEADPGPPNIFTAVQEQLGLKLDPRKEPVETIVIDHMEQPSAN